MHHHFALTLYELVSSFTSWMFSYSHILLPSMFGVICAVSWLFRAKRSFVIATASLLTVWGAFLICDRYDVDWQLYSYGMDGHWRHVKQ